MKSERIRVSKEFIFDMAHALFNYEGPCKNIHGHTYRLQITLIGFPKQESDHPKQGMLIDFGDLKQRVKDTVIEKYDHSLVLNADFASSLTIDLTAISEKIHLVPFQPTCENLLIQMKNEILENFDKDGFTLQAVRLYETPSSWAEWVKDDEVL